MVRQGGWGCGGRVGGQERSGDVEDLPSVNPDTCLCHRRHGRREGERVLKVLGLKLENLGQ